ncbi:MAG: TatD family hydrolase [Candidatus Melainabacteria bacterium]|nr:TatD family hydrolase [Candidatus Melainabacteria bacterium]
MAQSTLPSSGSIIDSHAHVVKEYFETDQEEVIQRAFDSGIVQMINPGVVLHSIPELLDLADRYEQIYTAVGLHPHDAKDWNDDSFDIIYRACRHPKVVAIGECGLDFFYNNSDHDSQVKALKAQIKIALETGKPIIIHCRDAWDETMTLLEEEGKGEIRGVFHCFTGGAELLPRIEKLDFYVSFSGIVTFPKSKPIQEAAVLVREERILVETDCPFLAPQKVRGKKNEPAYVWYTAEKLAELRNTTLGEIAGQCRDNARALFDLPVL